MNDEDIQEYRREREPDGSHHCVFIMAAVFALFAYCQFNDSF